MKLVQAERLIHAPLEHVFDIISAPEEFSKAVPHIRKIKFVSEQTLGVGTRYLETRAAGKSEHTLEMEVRDVVPNRSIRIVSQAGGTFWDTEVTVQTDGDAVRLDMRMEATPHNLLAKLMNGLIWKRVVKGVEADMDAVKDYSERTAGTR